MLRAKDVFIGKKRRYWEVDAEDVFIHALDDEEANTRSWSLFKHKFPFDSGRKLSDVNWTLADVLRDWKLVIYSKISRNFESIWIIDVWQGCERSVYGKFMRQNEGCPNIQVVE